MKVKTLISLTLYVVVGLFVCSLFLVPLFHPDHRISKVGVITNVETSGNPYFYQTEYTLTFQDGEILRVHADRSVPIPVGKLVSILYSQREKKLLGVGTLPEMSP